MSFNILEQLLGRWDCNEINNAQALILLPLALPQNQFYSTAHKSRVWLRANAMRAGQESDQLSTKCWGRGGGALKKFPISLLDASNAWDQEVSNLKGPIRNQDELIHNLRTYLYMKNFEGV